MNKLNKSISISTLFISLVIISVFSLDWLFPKGYGQVTLSIEGYKNLIILGLLTLSLFIKVAPKYYYNKINWFLFFISWGATSIIWSISKSLTIRDTLNFIIAIEFFNLAIIQKKYNFKSFAQFNIDFLNILIIISFISTIYGFINGTYSFANLLTDNGRVVGKQFIYRLSPHFINIYIGLYLLFKNELKISKIHKFSMYLGVVLILLSLTRSYILATFISIAVIFIYKRKKVNIFLVYFVAPFVMYVILIYSITTYDFLKLRMFNNPSSISFLEVLTNPLILADDTVVNSSGRSLIWEYLIDQLHGHGNKFVGGGLGGSKLVLQGGKIFANTAVAHSDYIKYYAELGLVGILLYAFFNLKLIIYHIKCIGKEQFYSIKKNNVFIVSQLIWILVVGYAYEVLNYASYLSLLLVFIAINYKEIKELTTKQ